MKFPLHELREILRPGAAASGAVVSINPDGTARIATRSGGIIAALAGVAAVGDKVVIENGVARRVQQVEGVYQL